MAKNKRKVYGSDEKERVSQCVVRGCRHFETVTEKVGATVRRVRSGGNGGRPVPA